MKIIITYLFIPLILLGCVSGKNQLAKITSQVTLGMSVSDFNQVVSDKQLIGMSNNITVYKVVRQVWYDSDASGSDFRYFYFDENKLTSIDQGERFATMNLGEKAIDHSAPK